MTKMFSKAVLVLGACGVMLMAQKQPSTPPASPSQTESNDMATKVSQAIQQDNTLASEAQNVKVSSHNGMVTLKGKVSSSEEKDAMVAKAKQVAGDANVKDDLKVAKHK
jgi:osmotically-inducible protein OsmY